MAEILIEANVGSGVSPTLVGRMLCDLGAVADAALIVGTMEARSAARTAVLNLAGTEPSTLLERIPPDDSDSQSLRVWLDQMQTWRYLANDWEEWAASRRLRPLASRPPFAWFPTAGEPVQVPPVVQRLIAADALERRGDEAVLTRARYENPVEAVLEATGGVLLAAGWLLTIVRDWRPQKRIGEEAATDAGNTARARERFRQILLRQLAAGEVQASPEEIMAALGDPPVESMARLAALRPKIEIPAGDEKRDH